MKKKIYALCLAGLALMLSLAACGKKDEQKSDSQDEEEQEEEVEGQTYQFKIWADAEDFSEENGSWIETRCNMFAAKYPDDEVIFEYDTCPADELKERIEADRDAAPDIFLFDSQQLNALVEGRCLMRLWGDTEEYVKSSTTPSIVGLVTYKGNTYGIPISAKPYVLYYNQDVYGRQDVKSLEAILEKGVLSYPLDQPLYYNAFRQAQDVLQVPEGGVAQEDMDAWIALLRENPNFLVDADGSAGVNGLADGTVQAAVYDAGTYEKMKEVLGERLGVAPLPVFSVNGVEKQMTPMIETKNIGVNPDCDNLEMTIALATYLGSADAQQMHYDTNGVIPVNLEAVKTMTELDLANVIAQLADRENPGWNRPQEEE